MYEQRYQLSEAMQCHDLGKFVVCTMHCSFSFMRQGIQPTHPVSYLMDHKMFDTATSHNLQHSNIHQLYDTLIILQQSLCMWFAITRSVGCTVYLIYITQYNSLTCIAYKRTQI